MDRRAWLIPLAVAVANFLIIAVLYLNFFLTEQKAERSTRCGTPGATGWRPSR